MKLSNYKGLVNYRQRLFDKKSEIEKKIKANGEEIEKRVLADLKNLGDKELRFPIVTVHLGGNYYDFQINGIRVTNGVVELNDCRQTQRKNEDGKYVWGDSWVKWSCRATPKWLVILLETAVTKGNVFDRDETRNGNEIPVVL